MINQNNPTKPWYKQFWPYFLFFFPFVAVVAGVITFVIAQNHSPAMVSDNHYKEGLAINLNKALEKNAKQLNLSVNVVATATTLTIHMGGLVAPEQSLFVELQHPAFAELDQQLELIRIAESIYQVPISNLKVGKWYIRVKNKSATWEINKSFFVSND